LKTTVKYIKDERIPADIRAILIKLISSIHVDKEPRTVQEMPNLIKLIEVDFEALEKRADLFGFIEIQNKKKKKDKKIQD